MWEKKLAPIELQMLAVRHADLVPVFSFSSSASPKENVYLSHLIIRHRGAMKKKGMLRSITNTSAEA